MLLLMRFDRIEGLVAYVVLNAACVLGSCFLVDPKAVPISRPITIVQEKAGTGVKKVVDQLLALN